MLRFISAVVGLALLSASMFSQTPRSSPPATRPSSVSRSNVKPWEYLVVSFGKTYFSDPNAEPEAKTAGLSKLLSYSKIGVLSATEGLLVEKQMDTLGKFGWELIGIVGAIGGDQQMVFRRAYDSEQSKLEAILIGEEGERLLALQREVATQASQAEFIDLDAAEFAAATNENRQREEARLRPAVENLKIYQVVEVKIMSTASTPTDSRVNAQVLIDGSNKLLKEGNKYRTSEAEALAKEVAAVIAVAADVRSEYGSPESYMAFALGEVKISVSIRVSFQGKEKVVATAQAGGNWPNRRR